MTSLPTSSPAEQSVDTTGVHAFLDALEAAPAVEPHSLMLLRHGYLVAEGWWAPYSRNRRSLLYSLSKSFTSTAVGLAAAEGLLDLDDRVVDHFGEFAAGISHPRSRSIRVRHLLAMSSGHRADMWEPAIAGDAAEPVRGFLLLPPEEEPGSVFAYNQPCTYTLAAIVQRAAGQPLTEYLRPRLFEPLGIGPVAWREHPAGRELGFSGLHAPTDAIARLGQLYLQRGIWQGRQLLPPGWVEQAGRPHAATAGWGLPDWEQGYGYQFWMSRHGYRGDGAYGQFCLVLPEQDAVLAITAQTSDGQAVLDAVWQHLLPALGDARPASGADDGLAERLAGLALPPVPADPEPVRPGEWHGAAFAPSTDTDVPSMTGAEISRDAGGWQVTLREEGSALRLPLGTGRWVVTEARGGPDGQATVPAATSGGWTGPHTLRVDVLFLETPHRLTLTCSLPDGTVQAGWTTRPLHPGPLHTQRSPVPRSR